MQVQAFEQDTDDGRPRCGRCGHRVTVFYYLTDENTEEEPDGGGVCGECLADDLADGAYADVEIHRPGEGERQTSHRLTLYESLVRKTPVAPATDAVELVPTEDGQIEDYSDDSGGSWIECSCGESFHHPGKAWDHVMREREDE